MFLQAWLCDKDICVLQLRASECCLLLENTLSKACIPTAAVEKISKHPAAQIRAAKTLTVWIKLAYQALLRL